MSSFALVIDGIKAALEADTALTGFCTTTLGRSLSVTTQFKNRIEIPQSKLPLIILTRPATERSFLNNNVLHGTHTLRLYAGIFQHDHRGALSNLIKFIEYIEDALWRITPELIGAMSITPGSSANDEGYEHPVYFAVMEVEIQHRRFKA